MLLKQHSICSVLKTVLKITRNTYSMLHYNPSFPSGKKVSKCNLCSHPFFPFPFFMPPFFKEGLILSFMEHALSQMGFSICVKTPSLRTIPSL